MVDYNNKEEQEEYLEQLMDNYKDPQNVGKIEDYTFFKHQKNTSCGDTFDIFVKLNEDNSKIMDVKFEGDGCAISTASCSLLSSKLIGMDFNEAKNLKDKDLYEIIGIKISPGRINCAMLSLNGFLGGACDFSKK